MTEADVRKAWAESTSLNTMADLLGCHYSTARKRALAIGLEMPAPHWGRQMEPSSDESALVLPEGVSDDAELLAYLQAKGYEVQTKAQCEDREWDYETDTLDGQGSFELGVVSDTHGGSKYAQRTFLNLAYDYFARRDIETVLHAGDITGGSIHMHPGIAYEQHAHGADQQAEYVCETYPQRDGIKTLAISGNHDHSHMKAGGVNVVRRIADQRKDIDYLGQSGAYVTMNGIRIYLHHPSGGVAYARSYRLQKTIEQFSPENKPKVLISGHTHVTCLLESYRNVYGFMAGCFEAQTPYLVEKGLSPEIGFSILRVEYDDDGAVGFTKSWKPCYVPRENDW